MNQHIFSRRQTIKNIAIGTALSAAAVLFMMYASRAEAANIRSNKTGAHASVSPRYASQFQAYIDDLEAAGATIKFIGGYRKGSCSPRHLHPCGKALDVCQLSRGRVDSRCHLPNRTAIALIAARHGLFEGGQWCNSDYGHAQVGQTAAPCNGTTASARSHRHHRRYAVAQPASAARPEAGMP
jgi:hypothetical protein